MYKNVLNNNLVYRKPAPECTLAYHQRMAFRSGASDSILAHCRLPLKGRMMGLCRMMDPKFLKKWKIKSGLNGSAVRALKLRLCVQRAIPLGNVFTRISGSGGWKKGWKRWFLKISQKSLGRVFPYHPVLKRKSASFIKPPFSPFPQSPRPRTYTNA